MGGCQDLQFILSIEGESLNNDDSRRGYSAYNSMFARLGTDYEVRNQCFFAILETMTTD